MLVKVRIRCKEIRHHDFEIEIPKHQAYQLHNDLSKQGFMEDLADFVHNDTYEHVDFENGKITVVNDTKKEME